MSSSTSLSLSPPSSFLSLSSFFPFSLYPFSLSTLSPCLFLFFFYISLQSLPCVYSLFMQHSSLLYSLLLYQYSPLLPLYIFYHFLAPHYAFPSRSFSCCVGYSNLSLLTPLCSREKKSLIQQVPTFFQTLSLFSLFNISTVGFGL